MAQKLQNKRKQEIQNGSQRNKKKNRRKRKNEGGSRTEIKEIDVKGTKKYSKETTCKSEEGKWEDKKRKTRKEQKET